MTKRDGGLIMEKKTNHKMQKFLNVLKWLFTPDPKAYTEMVSMNYHGILI